MDVRDAMRLSRQEEREEDDDMVVPARKMVGWFEMSMRFGA